MLQCQVLQELFWRHAGPLPEHALEMKWAHMDMLRDLFQRGLILEICLEVGNGFGDPVIIDGCLCRFHDDLFLTQKYQSAAAWKTRFLRSLSDAFASIHRADIDNPIEDPVPDGLYTDVANSTHIERFRGLGVCLVIALEINECVGNGSRHPFLEGVAPGGL